MAFAYFFAWLVIVAQFGSISFFCHIEKYCFSSCYTINALSLKPLNKVFICLELFDLLIHSLLQSWFVAPKGAVLLVEMQIKVKSSRSHQIKKGL